METAPQSLGLGVHAMTHRSALHEDNRMLSILPGHGRGQSQHISRLGAPRDQFEAKCRQMMTLIHDEMAVASNLIRHLCLADETLYQSNVDSSRGLTATAAMVPMSSTPTDINCRRRSTHCFSNSLRCTRTSVLTCL